MGKGRKPAATPNHEPEPEEVGPVEEPGTSGAADPDAPPPPRAIACGVPVYCVFDKLVDPASLVENPRNPNHHPTAQIEALAKIINFQGWRAPITVSKRSGFLVRGHGRLMAARLMQVDQVPVDEQDYATEAAEWADMVADNRIAELAELDYKEVGDLLRDLRDQGLPDLSLTGFRDFEIEPLLAAVWTPPAAEGEDPTGEGAGHGTGQGYDMQIHLGPQERATWLTAKEEATARGIADKDAQDGAILATICQWFLDHDPTAGV